MSVVCLPFETAMPAGPKRTAGIDEEVDVAFLQGLFVGRLDPDPAVAEDQLRAWLEGERPGDGVEDDGAAVPVRRADDDEPAGVFERR